MKAEIITINSHLLRGQTLNTNVAFLTRELVSLGIPVQQSSMIHNDAKYLKQALQSAKKRADLIILSGGLGPDKNDITKTTISEHLNIPLVLNNETEDRIISYHQNSDLPMPKNNQLQAMILMDSIPLKNVTGLAVGFFFNKNGKTYILLPGPFDELQPMFIENTRPLIIDKLLKNQLVKNQIYSLYGLTLSEINDKLTDLITYDGNPFVGVYYEKDEAQIQITARANSEKEAESLIKPVAKEVKDRMGEYIFGENDTRLAAVVKNLLKEQDKKITAAESLTGGSFLSVISAEAEASEIFEGGIVTYSNHIKNNVLKVKQETIDQYGVVSAQCAIEMAENSMNMFEADIGVSLTGVAGPASLEGEIPGTVWIGLAQKGRETFAKKFHFGYKRDRNRHHSVQSALNLVRLALLEKPIDEQVFSKQKSENPTK